jgi:para-aminobenzoate synthetase component I
MMGTACKGSAPRRIEAWEGREPLRVAEALRDLPGFVFFDTAGHVPATAGPVLSVLAARPRRVLRGSIHEAADRAILREALGGETAGGVDHGMPNGGLCGWVDYEGEFVFGDYDDMLVCRHDEGSWWESGRLSEELETGRPLQDDDGPARVGGFHAECGRQEFLRRVAAVQEWIRAGDIYQVNLSQAFSAEVSGGSLWPLYRALRDASPAPMAAWLSLDGREILSSSPELFLRFSGPLVETRPIKGTRPRFRDPDEDMRSAYELQTSPKEIAELVMITDLLRNDLGAICHFGGVHVAEMLRLETLGQVHHLVSTIRGHLRAGVDAIEAMAACFPGGSITGAPKIRAMEIIRELEGIPRGIYCGALGWLGRNGEGSFNIAIRTLVRREGRLLYQTGAGIVADSDPAMEYEETLHKAAGIRLALERAGLLRACIPSSENEPRIHTDGHG